MVYTSDTVESMDAAQLADELCECDAILYVPTDSERAAIEWVGHRYAVSGVLLVAMWAAEEGEPIRIDPWEIGSALAHDGVDRVPCMEDNALQRIVWTIGPDQG